MEHGEFFSADSVDFNDSLKYETVKGRTVYGGGGIMPDYFVPLDTSMTSSYVNRLFSSESWREFILDYVDQNKKKFADMSFEDFYNNYEISDSMLDELVKTGEKYEVKFNEKEFNKSKTYLKTLLKAHIARNLFDDNAFYKVINNINEIYQQALKLLESADALAFFEE